MKAQSEIALAIADSVASVLTISDEYEGSCSFRSSDVLFAEIFDVPASFNRRTTQEREASLSLEAARTEAYRRARAATA